jgi:glycosyltransferase involved in cell wall biosynthesis
MTYKQNPLISLVVPFYNEEEGIAIFYKTISQALSGISSASFEIVCVDDGSKDKTLELLKTLAQKDDRLVVIEFSRNFGKEAALTAGIDHATGDAVIPLDADLQDPPSLIGEMIEEWKNGNDVVLAKRMDRSSDSFLKRKTAEAFYRLHNKMSQVKIPENVGDFRLMDRQVVDAIKTLPERQRFMKGLFAWVGFKTKTIGYTRDSRSAGETKFSGWKLWNFALEGITSFSTSPLRIWTYIGSIGAILTFCYGLYIVIKTIEYGRDVPGYASLLVAVLFFGSLQLISVGLLGEYIGRIYLESKQRPQYIVRKVYGKKN